MCAWLALRPCKALGHTRLRHPCLACPSRCTKPLRPYNPPKTALSLTLHYHTRLPCQRELDCGKAFFILYIAILCDFSNVNICLALFAARLRDRLHQLKGELAAPHGHLTTCIAPSLTPDRPAIPQKSATLLKVGICCAPRALTAVRLSCR